MTSVHRQEGNLIMSVACRIYSVHTEAMGKYNLFWSNSSYQYFLIGTPEASMLSGDCIGATTGCQCHFDHTGVA